MTVLTGVVLAIAAAGTAYPVLTGRKLKEQQIPKRSIAIAILADIVGMFVIPLVGLFVGFAARLFVSEYVRHRDYRAAVSTSAATFQAAGTGIPIESGLVRLAGSVWAVGVLAHFTTR